MKELQAAAAERAQTLAGDVPAPKAAVFITNDGVNIRTGEHVYLAEADGVFAEDTVQ